MMRNLNRLPNFHKNIDEALEFFAAHGNVDNTAHKLRATPPTAAQLADAVRAAIARGAHPNEAEAARQALINAGHVAS